MGCVCVLARGGMNLNCRSKCYKCCFIFFFRIIGQKVHLSLFHPQNLHRTTDHLTLSESKISACAFLSESHFGAFSPREDKTKTRILTRRASDGDNARITLRITSSETSRSVILIFLFLFAIIVPRLNTEQRLQVRSLWKLLVVSRPCTGTLLLTVNQV